jgi:hypothetical protein
MDTKAAIFTDLTKRNALRRAAGVPALNFKVEYAHALAVAEWQRYQDICASNDALFRQIRTAVAEQLLREKGRDYAASTGGCWLIDAKARKQFEQALAAIGVVKPPVPARNGVVYGEAQK